MHLPWLARQYERTCADCGHSWLVPRQFVRVKPLPVRPYAGGGQGALIRQGGTTYADAADIQAYERRAEEAKVYRKCPECRSEHYTERPVRS